MCKEVTKLSVAERSRRST